MSPAARLGIVCLALALGGGLAVSCAWAADEPPAESPLTFERDIRPILKAHCWHCHGGEGEPKGHLDLRLRRLLLQGGDSGAAIVPGDAAASLLFRRVRSGEMPPGEKKLAPAEIQTIEQWLAQGAATARDEPPGSESDPISLEEREFWAFQPLRRPKVPAVEPADGARSPFDAYLIAALRQQGLRFSPEADRLTLVKRVYFDLLGLPPTPEQVEAFLTDPSIDAYERLVDRALASPHYGERWGRHWLDTAGYADSDGYTEADAVRPYAYKYRDAVIRALNADKPFDQFIVEQLAGDELVQGPYHALGPEDLDRVALTGFLRMGADGTASGPADLDLARNQVLAETIKIVSSSLLGLTMGCCQCHDHRYDPLPQRDYYRLRAVFEPAYDWKSWRSPPERLVSLYTDADRQRAAEVEAQAAAVVAERAAKEQEYLAAAVAAEIAKLPEDLREPARLALETPEAQRTEEQSKLLAEHPSVVNVNPGTLYLYNQAAADDLKTFDARIGEIRAQKPIEDFVSPLTEPAGAQPVTYLFHRGDHQQPREAVAPGGLSVLAPSGQSYDIPLDDPAVPTSGRRLALARWLTGGQQPLTARVLVNRVWMHHFGRGIVATPGDFGALGDRPSHSELLDWLADEFTSTGWSLKRLHRLMMTSAAYRQSSLRHPAGDEIDPENRLLWRMPVRRLEAEALRDRVLATSGLLNDRLYGPPVPVREDGVGQIVIGADAAPGYTIQAATPRPQGRDEDRRSVYIQVRRSQPLPLLTTFDAPVMETNCERRASSTVAPQSLLLLNSEFTLQQAAWFAVRVCNEAGPDPHGRIDRAWRLAFCRPPTEVEASTAQAFFERQLVLLERQAVESPNLGAPDKPFQVLVNLCQVLLSANEFLYVD
jgi:hypothetical protein